MPPLTQPRSQHLLGFVAIAALLLLLVLTFFGFQYIKKSSSLGARALDGTSIDDAAFSQNRETLARATEVFNDGNFSEAASMFTDVLDNGGGDSTLTSQQIDQARRGLLSKYRATGNPADSILAVQELKKTILDERMSLRDRAESLTTLANSLCWFGRSEDVVAAIFNEEPFSAYWHGDPTLANRDLLLLSYEKYTPTAKTAAALAYWYADQVILNDLVAKKLDAQVRTEYVAEAKRYIAESKDLSDAEAGRSKKYTRSVRYIGYLYRRAFAIGALAAVGQLPRSDYREAYALFHTEADRSGTIVALQYTPFAHVLEARFEKIFGASDAVVNAHLTSALRLIDSDPNPQSNEIVDFIRDKALDAEGRYSWHAIQQMRAQLKEFDVFVETVEQAGRP